MNGENNLWCGVHIPIHSHLGMGVHVAQLNAKDVAEEMGDVAIVLLFNMTLVKLWFFLWKPLHGFVKNGLNGSSCITCPHAVVCHHHDLIGIARRDGGEKIGTSFASAILGRSITCCKDSCHEEEYGYQFIFHVLFF